MCLQIYLQNLQNNNFITNKLNTILLMNYPNSSIREAIFDIKVDKINTSQIEDLRTFKEYIKNEFPIENAKKASRVLFNFLLKTP